MVSFGYFHAFRIFSKHLGLKYRVCGLRHHEHYLRDLKALGSIGIENAITARINMIYFRISAQIKGYRDALEKRPARVIAMSVLMGHRALDRGGG